MKPLKRSAGVSRVKGNSITTTDEILPEYAFSRAARNKHASQYSRGSGVVVLEPDVAATFPTAGEANEALRALAGIMHKHVIRDTARRDSVTK